MATTLSFSSSLSSANLSSILKNPKTLSLPIPKHLYITSSSSAPKARFVARRQESVSVTPLQRPLLEYMSLPASQYSVLDAQRIERIDDNTFRCYVYRFKFFAFEVCPVLLVRVEEQPNGCCINLLSCELEGSPIVVAQNNKFDDAAKKNWWGQNISTGHGKTYLGWGLGVSQIWAGEHDYHQKTLFFFAPWSALTLICCGHAASMENRISCHSNGSISSIEKLTSDTTIEVNIEIPFAFRAIPVQVIESSGAQVLEQILKIMLPRFMSQLVKDYQAWASGDASRQALGTGQI